MLANIRQLDNLNLLIEAQKIHQLTHPKKKYIILSFLIGFRFNKFKGNRIQIKDS